MSETEIEIQLTMLVDNELSAAERIELIAALDKTPHLWRQCAITFMDEQFLQTTLAPQDSLSDRSSNEFQTAEEKDSHSNIGTKTPSTKSKLAKTNLIRTFQPTSSSWLTLALAIGLAAGIVANAVTGFGNRFASQVGWKQDNQQHLESTDDAELLLASFATLTELVNEAEEVSANFQLPPHDNSSIATKSVRLFEIQNDSFRAVYYSPDVIPTFILEALVMAGHEVELTNEKLKTPIGGNQIVDLPIFAMRIDKNVNLINRP